MWKTLLHQYFYIIQLRNISDQISAMIPQTYCLKGSLCDGFRILQDVNILMHKQTISYQDLACLLSYFLKKLWYVIIMIQFIKSVLIKLLPHYKNRIIGQLPFSKEWLYVLSFLLFYLKPHNLIYGSSECMWCEYKYMYLKCTISFTW